MDSIKKDSPIVHIITGGINTGKTTKMLEIYNFLGNGDGFVLVKTFEDSIHIGQKILRLSTGESRMFSIKKKYLNVSQVTYENLKPGESWNEVFSYKDYSFSREGLEFADEVISDITQKNIRPIFIDEIGPLELNGKGFTPILKKLLTADKEIYLAVRDTCLYGVISMLSINTYSIITI